MHILMMFFGIQATISGLKIKENQFAKNQVLYEKVFTPKLGKLQENPIACINPDGELVYPGNVYNSEEFQFLCAQDPRGVLSFDAVACLGPFGKIEVGEQLFNGPIKSTCGYYEGRLKRIEEQVHGCYLNETVYREGEEWEQVNPNNSNVKLLQMECSKSDGYFKNTVKGCIARVSNNYEEYNMVMSLNEPSLDNGLECVETSDGTIRLRNITATDKDCHENGTIYRHQEEFEDEKRYGYCSFGKIEWIDKNCYENGVEHLAGSEWIDKKTGEVKSCGSWLANPRGGVWVMYHGCMVADKLVPYGQKVKIENGCELVCDQGKVIYRCEKLLDL